MSTKIPNIAGYQNINNMWITSKHGRSVKVSATLNAGSTSRVWWVDKSTSRWLKNQNDKKGLTPVLVLIHRFQRWPNNKPALVQHPVFSGAYTPVVSDNGQSHLLSADVFYHRPRIQKNVIRSFSKSLLVWSWIYTSPYHIGRPCWLVVRLWTGNPFTNWFEF